MDSVYTLNQSIHLPITLCSTNNCYVMSNCYKQKIRLVCQASLRNYVDVDVLLKGLYGGVHMRAITQHENFKKLQEFAC